MIDTKALVREILTAAVGGTDGEVTTKLAALRILAQWQDLARKKLRHGRREYISALSIRKIRKGNWQVYLGSGPKGRESLPWMIEFGMSSAEMNRNMRKAAAKSPKGYINVPMQHTAASINAGPHSRRSAARLTPRIDSAVRTSKQMGRMLAQGRRRGSRTALSNQPAAAGSGHTTAITSGLQRLITGAQRRTDARTGNHYYRAVNKYMTWRRFGRNSTWKFKGFAAQNLARKVLNSVSIT